LRHRTQGVMTRFGAAPAVLMPGARNAVETCLTIQAGERVALVSDAVSAPVAACLASALSDAGARWTGYLIEDLAPRPLADVPPAIADAFDATFDPSLSWVKTSGLISPQYWSNLPAGEVFTAPASVDGTFICNGMIGDYFGPKYGDLRPTPMVLTTEGGRLVGADCERRDL